jgi:hypothetical protein
MSTIHSRTRAVLVPLMVGLAALVASACAPEPSYPPYYGIYFYPPSVGYIGKQYTPTATATSGLPVVFTLAASSTGCSLVDGVVTYESLGSCVINANEPGDATHAASAQIQKTISVQNCPPLRAGVWTGPLGLSATVNVYGSNFVGTVDLTSLGFGVQTFGGSVACEVASMTFNSTPLQGYLSPDGSTLSSNYNGIDIVLNAPQAPPA